MAVLRSEDEDIVSSIEFSLGNVKLISDQKWQEFRLKLTSGNQEIELGSTSTNSEFLICRQPKDELVLFISALEKVANGTQKSFSFEPSEPSFELNISALGDEQGYKVEAWLDAGNATTGIYRWDAIGVRFHTVKKYLDLFIGQLKAQLQPAKI